MAIMTKVMQRALLAAFARGVGGGLSLAAVPYMLRAIGWTFEKTADGWQAGGRMFTDFKDAWRYFRELRGSFHGPSSVPSQSWQPEMDGHKPEE
jgi:hypothetical protein